MATLAIFAERAVVDVLVASFAFLGGAGEFERGMALFASHARVLPFQRKAGLIVFEFQIEP